MSQEPSVPFFKSLTSELLYLLLNQNYKRNDDYDEYGDQLTHIKICGKCHCHWWSHWVYLQRSKK